MVHPKTYMFFAMDHLVGPSPKMYEISPSPQGEIILFFSFTHLLFYIDTYTNGDGYWTLA
jgi:hypothetical protein